MKTNTATNRSARRSQKIKIDYDKLSPSNQLDSLIKILLIIIGLFVLFYFLTTLAMKNNYSKTNNKVINTDIQYKEILAGETFNKTESEYYVLFYHFDGNDAYLYNTLVSSYNKSTFLYTVDLDNGFNISYINNVSNPETQNALSLKIKGNTLIHIKNGRNISYQEGKESIINVLK